MARVCNLTPAGRRLGRVKGQATVAARTAAMRDKARELAGSGWPVHRISRELGVGPTTIYRYLRGDR